MKYLLVLLSVIFMIGCETKPRKVNVYEECKFAAPDAILYNPHNCLQFLSHKSCAYEGGVLSCQN